MSDSFATPWTIALPGYSVHGIFQARILEWLAISFSWGIFLTQGLNSCLLHCQADTPLSHQGSLGRETDTRPITSEINPEMPGLCTRRGIRPTNMSFGFYLHSRYWRMVHLLLPSAQVSDDSSHICHWYIMELRIKSLTLLKICPICELETCFFS